MTMPTITNTSNALALAVSDLDLEDATALRKAFGSFFEKADEWVARAKEIKVTSEDQKREMKLARESRLGLREIRINVEKTRKQLKERSLRYGKAVDGAANLIKGVIEPIEEYLQEQESFADRAAAKRRDALRSARGDALRALGADPAAYADLGAMTDDAWDAAREAAELAKKAREDEAARLEAIRVEAARIEDERREKARQEQIRIEAERAAREKTAKAERELAAEKERAAREQREREAAEAKARATAAAAPDREKLHALAAEFRGFALPTMTTERGTNIVAGLRKRLEGLAQQIDDAANAMASSMEAA
ncbi:MAG TPA: hypothetical protein VGH28_14095 [Polyangiaceae bacterium]|jgi:hypothetical protein